VQPGTPGHDGAAMSSPSTTGAAPSPEDSPRFSPQTPRVSWSGRLSTVLQILALVAAIAIFLGAVHSHYPIQRWLFWHYLLVGTLAALWALGCASLGCFLLTRFKLCSCSCSADLVLAFPVGVLAFQLAIFLLGLAGLLNGVVFALLPLAFLLSGAGHLREAFRGWRGLTPARTLPDLAIIVFGAGAIALLYFQILSPAPFSWDARWYHLPIAQQYALQGAVRAFPEGWWLAAYPHSASLTYTWAFLLPSSSLFDKLELCAHLELAVFLATIASIPALVRSLVPGASGRGTWVAIFLFPGIFLYDGNLHAGADHMAALWCIPVVLASVRVWKSWAVRDGILLGALAAAVILSKYSAWAVLVLPGFLFTVRAGWLAWRRRRDGKRFVLATFLACSATTLLLSAPHWLKNWIWYGDPLYPVLYRWLSDHPWSADSPTSLRVFMSFQFPPHPGWQGVKDALLSTLTFSFLPNNWPVFHRNVPVFGSLFTLTLLCLPFVRAGIRLWLACAGVMVAIIAWYLTNHQDRYLQAWLPIMAGTTAAVLILLWRRRQPIVRALVVALVAAQIIWGGDVPFLPTHNIAYDSPIRIHSNFLASGFLKTPHRLRFYGGLGEVGESLPRDAHLLLHELNLQLGLDVQVVNDQWQGRISYATLKSPAAIHAELSNLGVTHMIWDTRGLSGWNSLASDLAFARYALDFGQDPMSIDKYTVARLPATAPPAGANDRVAMLTCGGPYRAGFYSLGNLIVPEPGRPWAEPESPIVDTPGAIENAGFLVVNARCYPNLPEEVARLFHPPIDRESQQLYLRRRAP
jgi:hypothetical protein